MSGTIPLSMTQQLNEYGAPLNGGKLNIIQAGTVNTPQDSFQDPALTIKWPNPITMDAAGRLPQFFLADGFVKIRMTDSAGLVQREADNIQVIGPSSGGGGGGASVDPTALIQTGNLMFRYGIGSFAGYVRLNGVGIGNALSGASERANADTQALWIYLYGVDSSLAVSGGRTGNALNDYNANKVLSLPDWRGMNLAALDDMGFGAATRITAANFGTAPTVLGAGGGLQNQQKTLVAAEMPVHYHQASMYDPGHSHPYVTYSQIRNDGTSVLDAMCSPITGNTTAAVTGVRVNSSNGLDTTYNAGGGAAFSYNVLPPTRLCTFYIKL